jgi:ketosteroid isomerase-like protein
VSESEAERGQVASALDAFHAAASRAEVTAYLRLAAPDIVFLGTDPGDRWQGAAFRDFVKSAFAGGQGWTYVPSDRSITVSPDGRTAWFDERLVNEWYGNCRGTGVLRRYDEGWRIEQYHLTIPVPDALAKEVVALIGSASD